MDKLKLIRLRQENCGYNPEKALDFYKVDEMTKCLSEIRTNDLSLNDENEIEDNTTRFWNKTSCKDEIEFIEQFPNTYGIFYKNSFYIQD